MKTFCESRDLPTRAAGASELQCFAAYQLYSPPLMQPAVVVVSWAWSTRSIATRPSVMLSAISAAMRAFELMLEAMIPAQARNALGT